MASIARALEAQDLAALEAIMLEQVALATPGAEGEVMPRERARAWLAGRLERGVRVQDWRSVEHFGLVEIITGPWPKEPPLASGTVTFNLHRFNQRGQQDDVGGEWRIDVIIAE